MYRKFKLDEEQMSEVERLQQEQALEFKEKVFKIIELGSDYSSDFEEIEVSELISNYSVGRLSEEDKIESINVQLDKSLDQSPTDLKPITQNSEARPDLANMTFKPDLLEKSQRKNPESKTDQMIGQLHQKIEQDKEPVQTPKDKEQAQLKKTRITVKKRVKKVRPEGYDPMQKREQKRLARSFDAENVSLEQYQALAEQKQKDQERKKLVYENMFKNYQSNYARTIDNMIEESKSYFIKKAKQRTVMQEPEEVPEERKIQGKKPNQILFRSVERESAHQRNMRVFMEQLQKEGTDFNNRDAIEREEQQKQENERLAQEEKERQASIERRARMVIIREDLQKKQEKEERARMEKELEHLEEEQKKARSLRESQNSEQKNLEESKSRFQETAEQFQVHIEEQHGTERESQSVIRRSIDLKNANSYHDSTVSETNVSGFLGPKDMQNPQGESMGDEEDEHQNIADLADNLNQRMELQRLTQGGVAAVNNQAQQHRSQADLQSQQIAHANSARAHERDNTLNKTGGLRKQKDQNKKNLGPSTIRTIFRAADSREK